jgi:hypothetical protein
MGTMPDIIRGMGWSLLDEHIAKSIDERVDARIAVVTEGCAKVAKVHKAPEIAAAIRALKLLNLMFQ